MVFFYLLLCPTIQGCQPPGKSLKELLFSCKSWKIGVCYNLRNDEILKENFGAGGGPNIFSENTIRKNCWTSALNTWNKLLFNVQKQILRTWNSDFPIFLPQFFGLGTFMSFITLMLIPKNYFFC